MRNRHISLLTATVCGGLVTASLVLGHFAFARAGGGGSSSGGGDFGGFSSSSSSFGSSSHGDSGSSSSISLPGWATGIIIFIVVASATALFYFASKISEENIARRKAFMESLRFASETDPVWNPDTMIARAKDVFGRFQLAWSANDTAAMKDILSEMYLARATLELNVLAAMKRQNQMSKINIAQATITSATHADPGAPKAFSVTFGASAEDKLVDVADGKTLSQDMGAFTEHWHFVWEGDAWKLNLITQSTEAKAFVEPAIDEFAKKNGFFYDADFGWLMMPNKGALFQSTDFGASDLNNHVIGQYRNKIVEFYTYVPSRSTTSPKNYLVAQAVVPKEYHDVLIAVRSALPSCPTGLNEMSLEFPDFNEKFRVCAHNEDRINSLELLTPNFMAKIFDLPFELGIELVGNFLYLYTDKRDVSYDQMLEILSWAFDEMKA